MFPRRAAAEKAILAILLLVLCISLHRTLLLELASAPHPPLPLVDNSGLSISSFDPALVDFWKSLADALDQAHPLCPAIEVAPGTPPDNETRFEPDHPHKSRPHRLVITSEHEGQLLQSHRLMLSESRRLASKLHFRSHTRGIVTTAGSGQLLILLVSLRMLRRTGSSLPVDVFLDSREQYNSTLCEQLLPAVYARCQVLDDIYRQSQRAAPLSKFQFKIFAILFSSFSDVLFLDADAFPATNPDGVLSSEPYTSTGLVTWPDLFANTASTSYFYVADLVEVPLNTRPSTESGQVLLDKTRHAASLILMTYYNYYGPDYYYPLLCQGSHGAGDKETFIHAAMALNQSFYQVQTAPKALGHFNDQDFRLEGMAQHDPFEDWARMSAGQQRPSSQLENAPRPLFIHQHFDKLEPQTVFRYDEATRDKHDNYQRIWGPKEDNEKTFGRDVEREVWEELWRTAVATGSNATNHVEEYYRAVFGPIPDSGGP